MFITLVFKNSFSSQVSNIFVTPLDVKTKPVSVAVRLCSLICLSSNQTYIKPYVSHRVRSKVKKRKASHEVFQSKVIFILQRSVKKPEILKEI
jgi:hypothetical protein